jgi:hypothetical protein
MEGIANAVPLDWNNSLYCISGAVEQCTNSGGSSKLQRKVKAE